MSSPVQIVREEFEKRRNNTPNMHESHSLLNYLETCIIERLLEETVEFKEEDVKPKASTYNPNLMWKFPDK